MFFLQVFERGYAHNLFLRLGIADYEVAKAEIVGYGLAEVYGQFLGILVEEHAAEILHLVAVLALRRFDDNGQIGVFVAQIAGQAQAGLAVLHALAVERHVGDHAQHILAVFVVKLHGLLIVAGQNHLWAAAHAQHLLMLVKGLGGKHHRLVEKELEQVRKHRRIEAHGVLHKHYHLHAHLQHVALGVHLVLEQLYYGEEQVDVAQPREHIVDMLQVLVGQAARHLLGEGREHHDWHVGMRLLDCRGPVECLRNVDAGHGYYQVEILVLHGGEGFRHMRHARHSWRRAEVERHILEVKLTPRRGRLPPS